MFSWSSNNQMIVTLMHSIDAESSLCCHIKVLSIAPTLCIISVYSLYACFALFSGRYFFLVFLLLFLPSCFSATVFLMCLFQFVQCSFYMALLLIAIWLIDNDRWGNSPLNAPSFFWNCGGVKSSYYFLKTTYL